MPSPAQLVASLCAGRALTSSEAAIVGRVHERGDTLPAAGARVMCWWTAIALRDEHGAAVERSTKRIEGKTTADGVYRLCGVPANTNITVTASTVSASSGARQSTPGSRIVRAELVLERDVATNATFAGRVLVDSTTTPIEGAEIYFPELSKAGRSAANGEFHFTEIPVGEQHVIVRRVGYGALDTKLSFAANATLNRNVYLSRATRLDSVVVTDRSTERMLRDFEDNRRIGLGHFVDRAELAKLPPVSRLDRVVSQWPGIQLAFGTGNRIWITGSHKGPPPCLPPMSRECAESHGYYYPDKAENSIGVKVACYAQVYIDDVLMNRGNPTRRSSSRVCSPTRPKRSSGTTGRHRHPLDTPI